MKTIFKAVLLCILTGLATVAALPQTGSSIPSEYAPDGTPVLIKNLPEPESVRAAAKWVGTSAELETLIGRRAVSDLIEITRGIEAVVAVYPEGKLLLIEYPTPQLSIDADERFRARLAESDSASDIRYRRIGNYSVFIFDGTDAQASEALLDQIKYSKTVQWLGEDPNYAAKAERYLAASTANIFIGTVIAIVSGAALAIGIGLVVGFLYFKSEERRRASMTAFSDAGGMTRLNLDELSEPSEPEKD